MPLFNSFSSKFSFGKSPMNAIKSPTELSGLKAWYAADSITGVSNGGSISTLSDLSGNGYTLSGGATYVSSDVKFGNKPAIAFSAGFHSLVRNSTTGFPSGNQPLAMYIVGYSTRNDVDPLFGWGTNSYLQSVSIYRAYYVAGGPGGYYVDFTGTGAGGSYTSPASVAYVFAYSYGGGSATSYPMYQNLVPHSTGNSVGALNIPASMTLAMGEKPDFGGYRLGGSIAEAIVYNEYHNLQKITMVSSYLNSKYNIY